MIEGEPPVGTEFSCDLQWLVDLCRYDLGGEPPSFHSGVDAKNVVALAEAHRLTAIVERSWQNLAARSLVPAPPPALAERAGRARRHSFFAAASLSRLANALNAAQVRWVALKGPALSMQLYGDATIRRVRDLDIIVPHGELAAAVAAATSLGWAVPARWHDAMRITGRYDMALRPTSPGQPLLELHGALGPPYAQFDLDPFARDVQGMVGIMDAKIPVLEGPALATYIAWHGARGLWYRLCWLVDYARLLPQDEADARRLLDMARACKAECAVRAGAMLAHRLLGARPPLFPQASPSVTIRTGKMIRWSLERLRLGVNAPSVWSPPGSYLWLWREIAQQDSVWRSALSALDQLARPTIEDAERLGLGLPLAMHRLARPVFLSGRVFRDLRERRRPTPDVGGQGG